MNDFKKGDEVKITGTPCGLNSVVCYIGTLGRILEIDEEDETLYIKCNDGEALWFPNSGVKPKENNTTTDNAPIPPKRKPHFHVGDIVTTKENSDYFYTTKENGWKGKILGFIDNDYAECKTLSITNSRNNPHLVGTTFTIEVENLEHVDSGTTTDDSSKIGRACPKPSEPQPIIAHEIREGDIVSTSKSNPLYKGLGIVKRIMTGMEGIKTYFVSFDNESVVAFLEFELKYVGTLAKKEEKKVETPVEVKTDGSTGLTFNPDGSVSFSLKPSVEEHVNHPNHYQIGGKYEVLDLIRDSSTREEYEGFLRNNVIKYILRYKNKNGVEDCRKAQFYLNELIKILDPPTCSK